MNAKRHCHADTLIEVLVAMMILALSLTVIFRIFGGGLNKIGIASDYARAVMVAESVLAAAGNTEILQPGESSGSLFEKYRWTRIVRLYQADGEPSYDELPLNVYRVSVTVEWPATNGNRSLDLSTLKLDASRAEARR
jgi:general secretion pathway protein I